MIKINPQAETLNDDEVHLWSFALDKEASYLNKYQHSLSEDELSKLNRLAKPLHRRRAMAGKIQLRALLANYLQCSAASISFLKGEFGKPKLAGERLSFNLSHSQDKALLAITSSAEIGVDIEYWRNISNREGIVQRHYSEAEKAQWLSLQEQDKEQVFFDNWTRKEAFIKATGRGLGMGLSSCSFDLLGAGQLVACAKSYGTVGSWYTHAIELGDRVSASLMVKHKAVLDSARVSKIHRGLIVRAFDDD